MISPINCSIIASIAWFITISPYSPILDERIELREQTDVTYNLTSEHTDVVYNSILRHTDVAAIAIEHTDVTLISDPDQEAFNQIAMMNFFEHTDVV